MVDIMRVVFFFSTPIMLVVFYIYNALNFKSTVPCNVCCVHKYIHRLLFCATYSRLFE